MNLFFPQWQGGGDLALHAGALRLWERSGLEGFTEVPVSLKDELETESGILGRAPLSAQLAQVCRILEECRPQTVFTVGGGCDTELAPVVYLNEKYAGALSVIWFDAHGDLNTPASSKSKLFHGMPLRCLLQPDAFECLGLPPRHYSARLLPQQLVMVGTRDLDPPEAGWIGEQGIRIVTAAEAESMEPEAFTALLAENVYLHIDLDVLEPALFPSVLCPAPGGLTPDRLTALIRAVGRAKRIVGMSVLEYAPPGRCVKAEEAALLEALLAEGRAL